MKKKAIFLLGSIIAESALVGGTFAAWAVTDNADPFSVSINTITLHDTDNESVTLEWGNRSLIDVISLNIGEEKGPFTLGIKATTSNASAFSGSLEVSLEDGSTRERKLIDYLSVNVYENANLPHPEPLLSIPQGSVNRSVSKNITVTSGEEKTVYFYFTLDSNLTREEYNEFATWSDSVSLTVDWNKGSDVEDVYSTTFYYANVNNWENVYAYAWNSGNLANNADWPGVKMSLVQDNIYTAAIGYTYDKIIFNNGVGGEGNQTADLDVGVQNHYYNGSSWTAVPDFSREIDYYVVGSYNNWTPSESCKFEKLDTPWNGFNYHLAVEVNTTQFAFKVVSSANVWYLPTSTLTGEPNTWSWLTWPGTYDFYFNPEKVNYSESSDPVYYVVRNR